MRAVILRERNMRLLLAGQAFNMFGSTMMIIVLAIWMKDLTGSTGAAGLIFLLLAIAVLLSPLTGLLVDRVPRRWLLVANDGTMGLLILLLLTVDDVAEVWLVYVVTFLYGCSGQIYRAARGGLLHSMLPDDSLGDANGVLSSLGQGMRVIGPVVGAALYTTRGIEAIVIVDAVTFVLSAVSLTLLRQPQDLTSPNAAGDRGSFAAQVAAGARHVAGNPIIRRLVLASAIAFCGAGMINVALFSLVSEGLQRPTATIGFLGGIQGAGSVLAGLLVGSAMRRYGEYTVACVGFLLNGVGLAASSTATLVGVAIGAALVGLGLPLILVAQVTLVQRRTPADLQGRAIMASEAIINTPYAVAIGAGTIVIGVFGYRAIYLAVAATFTLVGLALLPVRARTRPRRPVEAQVSAVGPRP
ncbi:MFS transporter [Solwaraspora sp. WMMB335]|uniref:MFS transporter n=1 Tax=Solwaraspora sp. WMMB335 TaxID=3404118 RepID=UPI003B951FFB